MVRKKRLPPIVAPLLTVGMILGISGLIIAYGRGYRISPNTDNNSLVRSTGLLSTTSDPVGAQVFVDNKLQTATNNSVNIDPGTHTIRIAKEGYLSWEKQVKIEKEIVSRADAFLFPVNPSLSPLTSTGISSPILSPDGTKIVYLIPPATKTPGEEKNTGLWVYDLVDRPLGFNRDLRQVASWNATFDWDSSVMRWSPDSTELLIDTPGESRVYTINKLNDFRIVTNSIDTVLEQWQTEERTKELQRLSAFKPDVVNFASASAKIISFSPDETKFIYEATAAGTLPIIIKPPMIGTNSTPEERSVKPGKLYVYDSKEDKNYFLFDKQEVIIPTQTPTPPAGGRRQPTPTVTLDVRRPTSDVDYPFRWFPTNKHILLTLPGKIDILEFDRTNWVTVYAGPFVNTFAAPWPGGSRIIIVTNLNPGAAPLPNLYTVNLR